ncbi:MAG: M48 family metallopeptidase [Chloroflexi bacterium]|nr:M48 family metallopeptidase [Chloroflexota bacterium]
MKRAYTSPAAVAMASPASAKDARKDPEQIGNRNVGKGMNFYSLEDEIALGRQLASQVERQAKMVDDPVISEYVNRIGQNLARNSDVTVPVTIKIVDDPQVNAFALPGGFVFVHTGLLLKADSEAEVAGVLAHELAHVAARHGTRQASRGQIANLASIPLIFMGGWGGYAARQAAGLAVPLTFLKYSRNFEREADLLGLQYLYKAGYDPAAMVDFFEKLEAMERDKPGTMAELFRSHPVTSERLKNTQTDIQELLRGQPQYVVTTSEFNQVKGRLQQMVARRKAGPNGESAPVLRRTGQGPVIAEESGTGEQGEPVQDERPTLRRQTSSGGL